jgi:hypothetical protein
METPPETESEGGDVDGDERSEVSGEGQETEVSPREDEEAFISEALEGVELD